MAQSRTKTATYADIEALPPHVVVPDIAGWRREKIVGGEAGGAKPFDAISFSLGLLWPFDKPITPQEF